MSVMGLIVDFFVPFTPSFPQILKFFLLKRRPIGRLTKPSILIATHIHPNRLQDLFHSHVTIPITHGRQFVQIDIARLGIDAIHIDLGNKLDIGRYGGIIVGTVQT